MRTCEIDGCAGKIRAKGLCSPHYYARANRARAYRARLPCEVADCSTPRQKNRRCVRHTGAPKFCVDCGVEVSPRSRIRCASCVTAKEKAYERARRNKKLREKYKCLICGVPLPWTKHSHPRSCKSHEEARKKRRKVARDEARDEAKQRRDAYIARLLPEVIEEYKTKPCETCGIPIPWATEQTNLRWLSPGSWGVKVIGLSRRRHCGDCTAMKNRHASRRFAKSLGGRKWRRTAKYKVMQQVKKARRRARLKALPPEKNTLTSVDWEEIMGMYKHRCYYCKRKRKLTVDHVIPISQGGANTKQNVVPACLSCNSSKGPRPALVPVQTALT